MTNCTICGFHLESEGQACPNCEKMKRMSEMPTQAPQTGSGVGMITCDTCGNQYEDTRENNKVCPHCREIRMQDSVSRNPAEKTAAERAEDRKAALYEAPVEQVLLDGKNPILQYIPVILVVLVILIAVGAFVFMGG